MNHCKTCKYFSPSERNKLSKVYDLSDKSFGECNNRIFQAATISFPTYTKFLYYDHETGGHYCSFHVHEDFGCIGWKEINNV